MQLSALDRIEADIRITCGDENGRNTGDLTRHLLAIGGRTCGARSRPISAVGGSAAAPPTRVPSPARFTRLAANMPTRVGALDDRIIQAALSVLESASARSCTGPSSAFVIARPLEVESLPTCCRSARIPALGRHPLRAVGSRRFTSRKVAGGQLRTAPVGTAASSTRFWKAGQTCRTTVVPACSRSISTISSRSTITTAMRRATCCCARSGNGFDGRFHLPPASHGWEATSSWSL